MAETRLRGDFFLQLGKAAAVSARLNIPPHRLIPGPSLGKTKSGYGRHMREASAAAATHDWTGICGDGARGDLPAVRVHQGAGLPWSAGSWATRGGRLVRVYEHPRGPVGRQGSRSVVPPAIRGLQRLVRLLKLGCDRLMT